MAEEKNCLDCGGRFVLSEFYAHSGMADGHLNKCKECVKSRERKRRSDNLEEVRAYDRARNNAPHRVEARKAYRKTPEYARAHSKANESYRANHPNKKKAHSAFAYAILKGEIERECCAACSAPGAEGHHEDYNKPLDVYWLCDACHKARHKVLNSANRRGVDACTIDEFVLSRREQLNESVEIKSTKK